MLFFALPIPLTMVIFGSKFYKNAPKEINGVYGYRTSMSMKNKDTWQFAHRYCGRIWRIVGWIMLILSITIMLFVLGKSDNTIGAVGSILCVLQLIALIGPIFPTERALKKNFDENGNHRL